MSEDYTVYESTMNKHSLQDIFKQPISSGWGKVDIQPIQVLTEDEVSELSKKQINHTIRNYVRKERFNELEERYHHNMLILLDKISELERKLNEVYYPMRNI